ncbi:MAG TPA: hypothetical protein VF339_03630 [Gammaproteobacteria bacterium]
MKPRNENQGSPRKHRRFDVWNEEWVGPAFLLVAVVGVLVERMVYLNGPAGIA